VEEDCQVNRVDRAEGLQLAGRPADRESVQPRCGAEAEVGDGAAGREVAAGVAGFEDETPAAGKFRGQSAADTVAVVAAGGAAEFHAEEVLAGAAASKEES